MQTAIFKHKQYLKQQTRKKMGKKKTEKKETKEKRKIEKLYQRLFFGKRQINKR
jgi:hypothetical protein